MYAAIPAGIVLVSALPVWEAIEENSAAGWHYIGYGVMASFILTFAFSYFFKGVEKIEKKAVKYSMITLLAVIILVGSMYGATNYEKALGYMPETVQDRIDRVDFDETGFTTRVELMETAWDIIEDHPFGVGGGGWDPLYPQYMERDYTSSKVHSHIFQIGVETGIPGMIIFGGIWAGLIYQLLVIRRRGTARELYPAAGVFVAALALGGHSLIDFNLSLGAVSVYLWALFGLVTFYYREVIDSNRSDRSAQSDQMSDQMKLEESSELGQSEEEKGQDQEKGDKRFYKWHQGVRYAVFVVCIGLLVYSSTMFYGYRQGEEALSAMELEFWGTAIPTYEKAVKYDSLNYDYHFSLVQAYEGLYQETSNEDNIRKAVQHADRAIELNPEDAVLNRNYGQFMLRIGDIEGGLEHLKRAYQNQPYNEDKYLVYTEALISVSETYLFQEKYREGQERLQELIEFREEFLEYNSQSRDFDQEVFKAYVLLGHLESDDLEGDEQGKYEKAKELAEEADLSWEGELLPYLALMYHDLDEKEEEYQEIKEKMEDEAKEIYGWLKETLYKLY
ncbi:O-antigen polymerase [Natranaerobius thermophilus JW/NM-WN-LF]|uniref:O-antigen polymerase n=1 Tax=Natranaerobius thermophilus (strain ATCC BAA-1301 / DSM 18059 / JW/NM-WN-LF) TaxID=457570 RepID=B2A849_NATTJ|nr:O-antigen polymerase [Natranaerobius thermophilus JW/NM-WN-LF]